MSINWQEVVSTNVRDIVGVAGTVTPSDDAVCVLFDIDDAQAGRVSLGLQQVIADTKLKSAVPISATGGKRLVCLPISASSLIAFLDESEDTEELKSTVGRSNPDVLWVVCFDGDQRTCLDIHAHRPEFN